MKLDTFLHTVLAIFKIAGAYVWLRRQIDAARNSQTKLGASFGGLKNVLARIRPKPTERLGVAADPKGMQGMLSSAKALPSPLARVGGALRGVVAALGGVAVAAVALVAVVVVVAAVVALVAVLAALTIGTAKATSALLKYASAQADAARSERLRLEGLGSLRRWMRLTAQDAAQMSESINRVSERTPLARSEIAGYGQELHRLGIRGRAAEDALEALSLAQAVQGDLGRQRLMMLIRMAGHSEGAMASLAARTRAELGGVAARQMRSLGAITMRLRESFRQLFVGVRIEKLLAGLQRLADLLSQASSTGRALRAIFEAVLGPLADELGDAAGPLEWFLKELVILALRVTIAFLEVRNALQRTFGEGILGRLLRSERGMQAFRTVAVAAGVTVASLAAGVLILGAVVLGALLPLIALSWAMYRGLLMAKALGARIAGMREIFRGDLWAAAGRSMIDGIIQGLISGIAALGATMTLVAGEAWNSFRRALGIHSPSTVFAQLGLAIPQGVAEGVERGASEATGAVGAMMSTATTNVTSIRGGAGAAVTVGELHIHVGNDGENAEDTARSVTDALRDFFSTSLATEVAG